MATGHPISKCTAVSEGPPFLASVRGVSVGASGGVRVVSGPRSSSSLHCICNTCKTMFVASEMVSPLVSEGAVVSEGVVYRKRQFWGGQWSPIQLFFLHCVRNAWPPRFRGGCSFGRSH